MVFIIIYLLKKSCTVLFIFQKRSKGYIDWPLVVLFSTMLLCFMLCVYWERNKTWKRPCCLHCSPPTPRCPLLPSALSLPLNISVLHKCALMNRGAEVGFHQITNKQNTLNGLHSAQKYMAFSEVFILQKSVLHTIYIHGYDMGYKLFGAWLIFVELQRKQYIEPNKCVKILSVIICKL